MFLNDTQNYLSWVGRMRYIDIAMIIARNKSVPLTIGGGLLFDGETPEIIDFLNNMYEKNKMYEKLQMWEYQHSLIGRSVMFLYKNKNGSYTFRLLNPDQINRVGKIDEIEQIADVWILTGNTDNPVMEHWIWTKDYYTIVSYQATTAMINSHSTEINPETKPLKKVTYKNELGRIPLIETYNLPVLNFGGVNTIRQNPDCLPVWKLLVDIQDNWGVLRKEREMNRTRVYWSKMADDMLKYVNGVMNKELIADGFVFSSEGMQTSGLNENLLVQAGTPNFETYITLNDYDMKQLFNAAGYEYDMFAGTNYTNKTESLMNNKLDMQTTAVKQELRKQALHTLFDILLIQEGLWDGKGERPYSFRWIQAGMVDQIRENEIITARLENGTLSQLEAIMRYDNLNSETAKSKLEVIKQDQQEKMKLEHEQLINSMNEIDKQQYGGKDNE